VNYYFLQFLDLFENHLHEENISEMEDVQQLEESIENSDVDTTKATSPSKPVPSKKRGRKNKFSRRKIYLYHKGHTHKKPNEYSYKTLEEFLEAYKKWEDARLQNTIAVRNARQRKAELINSLLHIGALKTFQEGRYLSMKELKRLNENKT
jgi:hypothetical protein